MRGISFGVLLVVAACGSSESEVGGDASVDARPPCDFEAPPMVRVTALQWGLPKAGVVVRSFGTLGQETDLAVTDAQGIARVQGCYSVGIQDGENARTEPLAGRTELTMRTPYISDAPRVSVPVTAQNMPPNAAQSLVVATECATEVAQLPGSLTRLACAADLTTPMVAALAKSWQSNANLAVSVAANGSSLTFDTWSPLVEVPVTISDVPAGAWGTRTERWSQVGPGVRFPLDRVPTSLPMVVDESVNVDGARLRRIRRRFDTPPASVDFRFDEFPQDLADLETERDDELVPHGVIVRLPEAMDDCQSIIHLSSGRSIRVAFSGPQPAGLTRLRLPELPIDAEGTLRGAAVQIACWNGGTRPRWIGDLVEPSSSVDVRMVSATPRD